MKQPHNHSEGDSDLITVHAATSLQQLNAHLVNSHGRLGAVTLDGARLRHAEDHAIALTPQEQGVSTEAEKREYAADLLRKLARDHLGELNHEHLPLPDGDSVSIVATDLVGSWLEGLAIRVENGAEL